MDKRRVAKEWLIFISTFVFGFLIFPTILTILFEGNLSKLGGFYTALFDKRDFFIPWLIGAGPYLLVQIVRATVWSIKQAKQR